MARTPYEPSMARIAALVADPSRSRMLAHLLGGEYASAGELAKAAAVGAATASGHLAKLLDAGLLACEQRGRHRYYRLADAEVAHALQALAVVAERGTHAATWAHPARARLRHARCCYGHLAGEMGVALLNGLLARQWLQPERDGFGLTDAGVQGLRAMGMAQTPWQTGAARGVAYGCLDWSERRDHLAGRLARELLQHFLTQGWLRRRPGERALELTPAGHQALPGWFAPDAPP